MPDETVRSSRDYDSGHICKVCARFFADKEVSVWDSTWADSEDEEEPTLLELILKCPFCGEVRSYDPNEGTLRGLAGGGT